MKKYAVIVAGGIGSRMENIIPKQFLLIKGKPILWYSIDAFIRAFEDIQIILVVPETHLKKGERIAGMFDAKHEIILAVGGNTRFDSVKKGLEYVFENSVVFVHDGVRCLVSVSLIKKCYAQAVEKGSAVPATASTDSIRIMKDEKNFVENRHLVRAIQTPQTFLSSLILPAFQQDYKKEFTDEATVVESLGNEIFLVDGEYDNIKITRPIDLLIAEKIIEEHSRF